MRRRVVIAVLGAAVLAGSAAPVRASDHADPVALDHPEAGLTGLFVFPEGDRLVVVLGTRRGLTAGPPYNLEPYRFTIHMDLDVPVSFDDREHVARYGGKVEKPGRIEAEVRLAVRLDDEVDIASQDFEGLRDTDREIRKWAGVRDDPFIFPPFFRKNIVAVVLSIPDSAFPPDQTDWVMWATSSWAEDGEQIDHVGRANRTQLPRFDFLNTLHPSEHVQAIEDRHHKGRVVARFLMDYLMPVSGLYEYIFEIRAYDVEPDVLIYTDRRDPGFPNGRRLQDDVVGLTCDQGDCILQELAYADGEQWPRKTTNDKAFLDDFPYLAPPWPERPQEDPGGGIGGAWILTLVLVGLLVVIGTLVWVYKRWGVALGLRRSSTGRK